eukprot:s4351_g1.t1
MTWTSILQDLKEYYTLCQSLVRDDDAVPKNLQTTKSLSPWLWISDIRKAPEITGADLTTSTIHSCALGSLPEDPSRGLGLRFPRVLRVRQDKTPRQATTADQILSMYQSQPAVAGLRFNGCEGLSDLQGFCLGRAHRPSERRFVAEVVKKWPEFRPLHFHSRRVFRHGLTLSRGRSLLVHLSDWAIRNV